MAFAFTPCTSRIHIAYSLVGFVYSFKIFICITCIFVLHIYLLDRLYNICTAIVIYFKRARWIQLKLQRASVCIQNISIYIFDTDFSLFLLSLSLSQNNQDKLFIFSLVLCVITERTRLYRNHQLLFRKLEGLRETYCNGSKFWKRLEFVFYAFLE